MSAAPVGVVLVDDLRSFTDGRAALVARTGAAGVALLESLRHTRIEQLWLDHDLGGQDTVLEVVALLEEAAFLGEAFDIGLILVHSGNPIGAQRVAAALSHYGYSVRRVDAVAAGLVSP